MRDENEVKAALNALTAAMLSAQECNCATCRIVQDALAPAMSALMFTRGSAPYELLHLTILQAVRSSMSRAAIATQCEAAAAFERTKAMEN